MLCFFLDLTCQYRSQDNSRCYLHESPSFSNWLNGVTASLIAVGVIFDVFVFIFVKDLVIYGDEPEEYNYRHIPMQNMQTQNIQQYSNEGNLEKLCFIV